jgi:anti-anti-sigma regulatory factor
VVVDLTPTTFIDSVVLEGLISAQRAARAAGLGFAVMIGPEPAEPAVRRIFELTRLMSTFPVCDDRESALAAVRVEAGGG